VEINPFAETPEGEGMLSTVWPCTPHHHHHHLPGCCVCNWLTYLPFAAVWAPSVLRRCQDQL
jgi:hypothetical protein